MPEFCQYLNCHNLASSTFGGFCNEYHLKRSIEIAPLLKIIEEQPGISSLGEARKFLIASQTSHTLPKDSEVKVLPSKESSSVSHNTKPSTLPTS